MKFKLIELKIAKVYNQMKVDPNYINKNLISKDLYKIWNLDNIMNKDYIENFIIQNAKNPDIKRYLNI